MSDHSDLDSQVMGRLAEVAALKSRLEAIRREQTLPIEWQIAKLEQEISNLRMSPLVTV